MSEVFTTPPAKTTRRQRRPALRKDIILNNTTYTPRDNVANEAGVAIETARKKCRTGIIYVGGCAYGEHDQMMRDLLGLNQAPQPHRRSLKK